MVLYTTDRIWEDMMSDDLALPLSLEDAAKATKQIFKIFDEIAKRGGAVAERYNMHRRRKAADGLDYLRFGEGGSLTNVARIARGEFDVKDFEVVGQRMDETATAVESTISDLLSSRNTKLVREKIGIEALTLLEKIVYGEHGKGGKRSVRKALYEIRSFGNDPDAAQQKAREILQMIDELNQNIFDLHNALLKQKKKMDREPSAKVGKAKAKTRRASRAVN
jgi:hypothetical protein